MNNINVFPPCIINNQTLFSSANFQSFTINFGSMKYNIQYINATNNDKDKINEYFLYNLSKHFSSLKLF